MATSRKPRGVSVIDIACPACGRIGPVRKVRIGAYRCTECGHEFDHSDLDPMEQSEG